LQYVLEVEQCDYARLEVSSPGLDRPLKKEADYQRFAGSAIELALKLPFQGRRKFKGVLAAREGGWRLAIEPAADAPKGAPEQVLDFVFDEVREARLVPVIDFKGRKARQAQAVPEKGLEATASRPPPPEAKHSIRERPIVETRVRTR
jgi:ribosome maturation factor RimP